MLSFFRRKAVAPLPQATVSRIRSHARALIRCANLAETAGSRVDEHGAAPGGRSKEWRAMTSCEAVLTKSIAAAAFGDVTMHVVVHDVIGPILKEAIVLSETAHDAVTRAVTAAQHA